VSANKISAGFVNPGAHFEEPAMNVRPLQDRILVRRVEEQTKTKGGLIIPDSAKERPLEGNVIAVGAGKREEGKLIPLDVKAGDRVLFGKYSGSEIKVEGIDHVILREDEILGIVE
jgi:chaperonin GroES